MNEYRVTYHYPGEDTAQCLVRARNWHLARVDCRASYPGCNVVRVEIRVNGNWQSAYLPHRKPRTLECPPPITRRVQLPMRLD